MPPIVSVIMATYHRANVLAMAIETVRRQTFGDWELIVVGDACTDETAEVVAGMNDPRVRFVNLEKNCGEQSGPNNHGCSLARGKYVAFLNHDDFWMPGHLAGAVAKLEETGADLVFSLIDIVEPNGGRRLDGMAWSGRYDPTCEALASSWVFRRGLLERVGPWRSYRKCWAIPSQDWILRAWRRGAKLIAWPEVTVVAIQSFCRKDSYASRLDGEHRAIFEKLTADAEAFRASELALLAEQLSRPAKKPSLWKRVVMMLGLHPKVVREWLRLRFRRGASIDKARRVRGLPALHPES